MLFSDVEHFRLDLCKRRQSSGTDVVDEMAYGVLCGRRPTSSAGWVGSSQYIDPGADCLVDWFGSIYYFGTPHFSNAHNI